MKKCFTIETRLETSQFPVEYFEQDMEKQNRLFRVVWKLIQEKKWTQSQLNTHLQMTYQIDKRTANTLIQTAKGCLKALKELKTLERANLLTKMTMVEKQRNKYRRCKRKLWQKKQKLNRTRQQAQNYERMEKRGYYPICWGSRQLFKAQYYLEENGFLSHEGWANAYRRKRDGQVNFIGSKEEPMGNQNCQLSYDRERDCFSLRVRKDLEFMEHEKDKFFVIPGLQFSLHREQLIRAI